MGYNKSKTTAAFLLTCITLLSTFPQKAASQYWRLSATYNMQSVGFNYVPNRTYSGDINKAVKGMLEVGLERYLLYRLYVAGKGELLVQNQEDFLIGGPVNFNQINFGATAGLQWPKLGVYGGVKAGGVWNFNIKATDPNGNQFWVKPTENADRFTTSFTGGVKYYLLNFVRLQAEITKTNNLPQNVIPESSFTESPAFRSFDFSPVTFSVGVSISIPWNERVRPEEDKTKLPPVMRVTAVNFDKPMDETFVTSKFGPRWRSTHEGVDLDANLRDNIYAAEQGVVVKAGNGRGYGKMVRIKHSGGFETVYAHMSKIKVKEGDRIKKGQVVGKAGNTGTSSGVHLHFEILKDGKPVNPESYIRF
ncbi:M23 family metallopeptidase [Gracilimonas sp.]|uniref:M23 family metallopeptidase n=1 Tax=Gracilimonas sp. TaxID=1974203 RepID=UPI003BA94345